MFVIHGESHRYYCVFIVTWGVAAAVVELKSHLWFDLRVFLLICVVRKLVFSSVLIWLFVYASAFNCLLPQSHLICHKPYFNLKEFLFFFIVFSKQSHPLSLELLGNAYLCKKLHYFFVCMKFGKILTFSWFCCKIRSKQLNIFPLFFQTKDKDGLLSLKLADASSSRCWLPCPGSQHLVGEKGVTSFFVCVMSLFCFL